VSSGSDVSGADTLDSTGVRDLLASDLAAASEPARGAVAAAAARPAGCSRGPSDTANVTCFVSPSRSRLWPNNGPLTSDWCVSLLVEDAAAAGSVDITSEAAAVCDLPTLPRIPSCFLPPRDLAWTGGGGMHTAAW
jgi:hypothetical protein